MWHRVDSSCQYKEPVCFLVFGTTGYQGHRGLPGSTGVTQHRDGILPSDSFPGEIDKQSPMLGLVLRGVSKHRQHGLML